MEEVTQSVGQETPLPPVAVGIAVDAGDAGDGKSALRKPTQAELLVVLCEQMELFHNAQHQGFATFAVGGHTETHALRSVAFRRWLSKGFYERYKKAPKREAIEEALSVLNGQAEFDGPELEVQVRIAGNDNEVYVDLGDPDWRVVKVTNEGWEVTNAGSIKFWRPDGMEALPVPEHGGSIDELREFINVPDDQQFRLFVGVLVGAFNPNGPYAILEVNGEQGSAKSTLCDVFKELVDPHKANRGAAPKNERDVAIATHHTRLPYFDNCSRFNAEMCDALCRISTGGSFSTRQLFTDDGLMIFEYCRPMVMNGISELATRGDLLERTVVLDLTRPKTRRDERELMAGFRAAKPRIVGALLDAVASAQKNRSRIPELAWPRLADFAKWVTAAEEALGWHTGTFIQAMNANRREASLRTLEAYEGFTNLVKDLVAEQGEVTETATNLLQKLNPEGTNPDVPRGANQLSGLLKRLAPALKDIGVEVTSYRQGHESIKFINLRKVERTIDRIDGIDGDEVE